MPELEQLLTAREVAEILNVSPATVLDWHEAGKIPSFKFLGRAVRFRRSEIAAFIEEHRTPVTERNAA